MSKILIESIYSQLECTNCIIVDARMSPGYTLQYTLNDDVFITNAQEWQLMLKEHMGTTFFTITGEKEYVDKFAHYILNGPPEVQILLEL